MSRSHGNMRQDIVSEMMILGRRAVRIVASDEIIALSSSNPPMMQSLTTEHLSSSYFSLLQTPSGGRSLFATVPIPANTVIHISHTPCASVVYREFRKVVCAWCFAHKDDGGSGWCVSGAQGNARERFCQEVCRDFWIADGLKCGGLREKLVNAIDAAVRKTNKSRATSMSQPDFCANGRPDIAVEITQSTLDAAWIIAGREATATTQLDEMELEIARFVSSALIQLFATSIFQGTISGTLPSILALQENELPHAQQRPYILPTHIRIFQFLRAALSSIPEMRTYVSMDANGKGWVRSILSRDAGNSFGIWEQTEGGDPEEREMFGWGIWTDASFFNHNCSPNVIKSRLGRALHFTTTKAVAVGEELCISYVDVSADIADLAQVAKVKNADANRDGDGRERRKKLWEQWFFNCGCERCSREKLRPVS